MRGDDGRVVRLGERALQLAGPLAAMLADYEMSGGSLALVLLVFLVLPVVAIASGTLLIRDGLRAKSRSRGRVITGTTLLAAALAFWAVLAARCK